MPEGGTLRIETSLEGEWIVIRVCDTGCGFDDETLARIFEPFWSTKDLTTTGPSKATGLGLAVAHGAVHAVGGTIEAESTVNKGTCFTIRIPKTPQ